MTAADAPVNMLSESVRRHSRGFLAFGIVLLLVGIAAIVFPLVTVLAVELLVGWVLLINGVLAVWHAWSARHWRGFGLSMLTGLLSLAVGLALLLYPVTGVLSLTLLVAVFLIAEGILRATLAVRLRPLDHWGTLLASGILSVVLGVLILSQWPEAAAWLIGVLVGIDLVAAGLVAILLATASRAAGRGQRAQ